ncbi:MAG: DUF1080 domain-containing protein [Phycisphaerales bacterium]|jgi:hypothetical protein|nr:DUF1080 domain-containing protein [Phycisphaerales bacterium]
MHRHIGIVLVIAVMLFVAADASYAADGFKPLFDGKTLKGWKPMPGGEWTVKDGAIVGTSVKSEHRHGLLMSEKEYSDFVVNFKFRVIKGDSGFYFRSDPVKSAVGVHGFQMEIDNSKEVGGLYETGGRGWVKKPDAKLIKKIYQPGKWNQGSITVIGKNVTVRINGEVTSELKNDKGRLKGRFAMQLHGRMDMEVMFKDIEIKEAKPADDGFVEMFNGKDLTGWKTTGNWKIQKGNILTLEPREGEHGWQRYHAYITTVRKYKDFIIDLEFKFKKRGNSGVFLRVADPKNHVETGFEIQILDTHGKKNFGHHDCGGVIRTAGPSKMMVKPAGEWNRYIISVIGSQLKVNLNGEDIHDLDLSKTVLKDRPLSGYIGFQDEAKYLWYRNVRIKELNVEKTEKKETVEKKEKAK